jgi:hypothetical protein
MSFMLESGLSIHRLLSVCIRKRKVQGRYRTGTDAYSAVSPYNPDRLFLITTPFLFTMYISPRRCGVCSAFDDCSLLVAIHIKLTGIPKGEDACWTKASPHVAKRDPNFQNKPVQPMTLLFSSSIPSLAHLASYLAIQHSNTRMISINQEERQHLD